MKTCFFYPGQGAQFIGMGKDLYDRSTEARELFALASSRAGIDIPALIFEASDEEIKATDKSQIAITTVNLAARRVLAERGVHSDAAAGFSLGEYAALVDAGVLSEATCLSLVWERGRIMEEVSRSLDSPDGSPGMIAVLGIDEEATRAAIDGASLEGVFPANLNSPVQTVLSGTADGLQLAAPVLKEAGARRVIPLKVSGPFHSPLMEDARAAFAGVLDGVEFADPVKTVFSNVTGRGIASGDEARALCSEQLVKPVRWVDEEMQVADGGIDRLYEVGPGEVLTGLWKAFAKTRDGLELNCVPAGTAEQIEAIE